MRVIILSKASVAGKVKTRLMPEYSAKQAAQIHQQMLEAVVAKVCAAFGDVWLAVDDVDHECFKSLQQSFAFKLIAQDTGDLGQRLRGLMQSSFAQDSESIMFLGTDSPHVDANRYQAAKLALKTHSVILGPVEDGGYDLIGLRQPYAELFEGVRWGSKFVFAETINIINKLELSVEVLEVSFDLDRPEDLERAPPGSW